MRHSVIGALAAASIGLTAPVFAQSKATVPDFKDLMRRTMQAWATLDPAKAAPFYAKDADAGPFFDIEPLKYATWTDYAQGTTKGFAEFASMDLTLNDDARTERHGDAAWGTATVRAAIAMKNGTKMAMDARWTVIWEKKGSDWLIVHEHFSAPMPPPPAPPAPPAP